MPETKKYVLVGAKRFTDVQTGLRFTQENDAGETNVYEIEGDEKTSHLLQARNANGALIFREAIISDEMTDPELPDDFPVEVDSPVRATPDKLDKDDGSKGRRTRPSPRGSGRQEV